MSTTTSRQLALVELPSVKDAAALGLLPGTRYFKLGECSVILAREKGRWHISIGHPSRFPTWDELKEARYRLVPDGLYMAMFLPPPHVYVNVHPNVFHFWEVDAAEGRSICGG